MNLIKIIFFIIASISAASVSLSIEDAAKTEAFIIECCINPGMSTKIDKYFFATQDEGSQNEAFIIDCCLDPAYTPSVENHIPGLSPSGKYDKVFCLLREGISIHSAQKPAIFGSTLSAFSPVKPEAKAQDDRISTISTFDISNSPEMSSSNDSSPSENINTENLTVSSASSSPTGHCPLISRRTSPKPPKFVKTKTDSKYKVIENVSNDKLDNDLADNSNSSSTSLKKSPTSFNFYHLQFPRKAIFITEAVKFKNLTYLFFKRKLPTSWSTYALIPSCAETFESVRRKLINSPRIVLHILRTELFQKMDILNDIFEDETIYSTIRFIWLIFEGNDIFLTVHFNDKFHDNEAFIKNCLAPFKI